MNNIEREINAIRANIYEEIKDMSCSEMNAYIREQVTPLEKRNGIKTENEPRKV